MDPTAAAVTAAPSDPPRGSVDPHPGSAGRHREVAGRHREVAGRFTALVHGAQEWDAPTPVAAWRARDVVRHLIDWSTGFLAGVGVVIPGAAGDADPVATWDTHAAAVQALLDDPGTAGQVISSPHLGDLPLGVALDRIYTTDALLHTWDLARATGQDDRLDPDVCAALLAGMEPMEGAMRGSGHYGPRVPVPAGADPQARLLGFIGRDPAWRPVA